MLRIDTTMAARILREEASKAAADPGDPAWVAHIERLSQMCEDGDARTHLAYMGTALLAKSVDARSDLKHPKPKLTPDVPNSFSARSLAHGVLVPIAVDLGIHIGVTGKEPLNNQPYFRMTFVGDDTPVRGSGKPAFDFMVGLLDTLAPLNESQSRNALRAYISVRKRSHPIYREDGRDAHVSPQDLALAISRFVGENSEGGKRAQACVAGLFDVVHGADRVDSGRINDPSRHYPGDVCVIQDGTTLKAVEVKDKPVAVADVQIFVRKAIRMDATDCAYVLVAQKQQRLDDERLAAWAGEHGIGLTLFYDWQALVAQALYWSPYPVSTAAKLAAIRIRERLVGVEANPTSVEQWTDLTSDAT